MIRDLKFQSETCGIPTEQYFLCFKVIIGFQGYQPQTRPSKKEKNYKHLYFKEIVKYFEKNN